MSNKICKNKNCKGLCKVCLSKMPKCDLCGILEENGIYTFNVKINNKNKTKNELIEEISEHLPPIDLNLIQNKNSKKTKKCQCQNCDVCQLCIHKKKLNELQKIAQKYGVLTFNEEQIFIDKTKALLIKDILQIISSH